MLSEGIRTLGFVSISTALPRDARSAPSRGPLYHPAEELSCHFVSSVAVGTALAGGPPDGLPWAPATDGLRNITGIVNGDGTATIFAITSTVSGNGDSAADPNNLVVITDTLSATTLPGMESFTTLRSAGYLEALRGVSFTPGT